MFLPLPSQFISCCIVGNNLFLGGTKLERKKVWVGWWVSGCAFIIAPIYIYHFMIRLEPFNGCLVVSQQNNGFKKTLKSIANKTCVFSWLDANINNKQHILLCTVSQTRSLPHEFL